MIHQLKNRGRKIVRQFPFCMIKSLNFFLRSFPPHNIIMLRSYDFCDPLSFKVYLVAMEIHNIYLARGLKHLLAVSLKTSKVILGF